MSRDVEKLVIECLNDFRKIVDLDETISMVCWRTWDD
jgi:hypothetical protein